MKKLLSLLLACALCAALAPPARAAVTPAGGYLTDDLRWSLSSDGTLTIDGDDEMPDFGGTNQVPWLKSRDAITKLVIGEEVERIGNDAFSDLTALKEVSLSFSEDAALETIGENAFSGCTALTAISLPDNVEEIGKGAFSGCTALTRARLSSALEEIPEKLFSGCAKLAEANFLGDLADLESVGDRAFANCRALQSVSLRGDVETIGKDAFTGCSALRSVSLPEDLEEIGESAFAGCISLQSMSLPGDIEEIPKGAFSACTAMTSISLPEDLETIGNFAFSACNSLTSISIPGDVETIGESAFAGCVKLTQITIPGDVETIGKAAFRYCNALRRIDVSADNDYYSSDSSGALYNLDKSTLIFCPQAVAASDFTIPSCVSRIEDGAFFWCTALRRVTIPVSVSAIGESAFYNCSALTDVSMGGGVLFIGKSAFAYCSGLKTLTLPGSLISMGDSAFYQCKGLTDVYFTGGEARWKMATRGDNGNVALDGANIHFNAAAPVVSTPVTVAGFSDAPADAYYADALKWAVGKKITAGTGGESFSPNEPCSRAQILTMLYRAVGSPEPGTENPFTDLSEDKYYYKAALWAAEKGLVTGDTFRATAPCTRAGAVNYFWIYSGSPAATAHSGFADVSRDYAAPVDWAVERGITTGINATTFGAFDNCTRAQIVTFLYRLLG